jgi:hypothetical protein
MPADIYKHGGQMKLRRKNNAPGCALASSGLAAQAPFRNLKGTQQLASPQAVPTGMVKNTEESKVERTRGTRAA